VTRECTKCGQSPKRTKEFWMVEKRSPDGLGAWCRVCRREYDKAYKIKNTPQRDRRLKKLGDVRKGWTSKKKRCSFCGVWKPLSHFHGHKGIGDPNDKNTRCKACEAVRGSRARYTQLGQQYPHHDYARDLRRLVGHRVVTRKLRIGKGIGFKGQRASVL